MKYKYRKLPSNTDPSQRFISLPLLQVRLFYGSKYKDVICLLDTGAIDCMFHTSIADVLGIDVKSGREKTYYGIGGHKVVGHLHTIQLQIQGFSELVDLEVAFTDGNDLSLLGQTGFFDNYQVTFERYKGRFQIQSRPRLPTY